MTANSLRLALHARAHLMMSPIGT